MARYYRRRTRTVVRAPKKKWATNIVNFNKETAGTAESQFALQILVENSTQIATPTPVIIKTGNFKVQGDVYVTPLAAGVQTEVSLYVLYMPEGVTITGGDGAKAILMAHPEWIMAWKYVTANRTTTTNPDNTETFSFRSRLKRNLNSGDKVVLLCLAQSGSMNKAVVAGMAQYWTCAN